MTNEQGKLQERLDRKLVRKAHIFRMYEDTIRMPDGHIAVYDYLEHKGAAAVVPVLPDGRILLVSQYRDAVDRLTLEIPAGGRNNTEEDYAAAAGRELEEETGYRPGRMTHLVDLRTAPAFSNELVRVYMATDLTFAGQNQDPDEFIGVCAYTTGQLREMIFQGQIQDSKTVAAVMSYLAYVAEEQCGLQ